MTTEVSFRGPISSFKIGLLAFHPGQLLSRKAKRWVSSTLRRSRALLSIQEHMPFELGLSSVLVMERDGGQHELIERASEEGSRART